METKAYLTFFRAFPKMETGVYKWNEEKQWWLKEDGSGNGFSLDTVSKYNMGPTFNQFDTKEEAEEHIRYRLYAHKHGSRDQDGDFVCPKCGYQHVDDRDYEGYSGCYPEDDFSVKCFCGHLISVSPKLVYEVE